MAGRNIVFNIQADPSNAVRGLEQVDAALQEVEQQSRRTRESMGQVGVNPNAANNARALGQAISNAGRNAGAFQQTAGATQQMANNANNATTAYRNAANSVRGFNLEQQNAVQTAEKLGETIKQAFVEGLVDRALGQVLGGIQGLFDRGLDTLIDAEKTAVSFEVIIGNTERAKALLDDLFTFAKNTPFDIPQVQQAGKTLLAMGFTAEEIKPQLETLGNIASAVNIPLGDLAVIFGKARTEGRIMNDSLTQLGERGLPVMDIFARQLGVSVDQVRKMSEQGKISFDNLNAAFQELGGEGGKFFGLMEKQSQTLGGRIDTLNDELNQGLKQSLEALYPVIELILIGFKSFIQGINEFAQVLQEIPEFVERNETALTVLGVTLVATTAAFTALTIANSAFATSLVATSRLMLTTPWGLALSGILSLVAATIYLTERNTEYIDTLERLEDTQTRINDDIRDKTAKGIAEETTRLYELQTILESEISTKEEKDAALKELNANYDEYLSNIGIETATIENMAGKYDLLAESILKVAEAKARAELLKDAIKENIKLGIQQEQLLDKQDRLQKQRRKSFEESSPVSRGLQRAGAFLFGTFTGGETDLDKQFEIAERNTKALKTLNTENALEARKQQKLILEGNLLTSQKQELDKKQEEAKRKGISLTKEEVEQIKKVNDGLAENKKALETSTQRKESYQSATNKTINSLNNQGASMSGALSELEKLNKEQNKNNNTIQTLLKYNTDFNISTNNNTSSVKSNTAATSAGTEAKKGHVEQLKFENETLKDNTANLDKHIESLKREQQELLNLQQIQNLEASGANPFEVSLEKAIQAAQKSRQAISASLQESLKEITENTNKQIEQDKNKLDKFLENDKATNAQKEQAIVDFNNKTNNLKQQALTQEEAAHKKTKEALSLVDQNYYNTANKALSDFLQDQEQRNIDANDKLAKARIDLVKKSLDQLTKVDPTNATGITSLLDQVFAFDEAKADKAIADAKAKLQDSKDSITNIQNQLNAGTVLENNITRPMTDKEKAELEARKKAAEIAQQELNTNVEIAETESHLLKMNNIETRKNAELDAAAEVERKRQEEWTKTQQKISSTFDLLRGSTGIQEVDRIRDSVFKIGEGYFAMTKPVRELNKEEKATVDNLTKKQEALVNVFGEGAKSTKDYQKLQKEIDKINKAPVQEKVQQVSAGITEVVNGAAQAAGTIMDIQNQRLEASLTAQQEKIDEARKIADEGNAELLQEQLAVREQLRAEQANAVDAQINLAMIQMVAQSAAGIANAAAQGGVAAIVTIPLIVASIAAGIGMMIAKSKQLRAQLQSGSGFEKGGYTGAGHRTDVAGVVHAGEFVFTKDMTDKNRDIFQRIHEGKLNLSTEINKARMLDALLNNQLILRGDVLSMGKHTSSLDTRALEERLNGIEMAIRKQDRLQLSIDEKGIHSIVSRIEYNNKRIRQIAK